jgi:ABC-type nitrate/sulfonate/bicarbonate transport system permease component
VEDISCSYFQVVEKLQVIEYYIMPIGSSVLKEIKNKECKHVNHLGQLFKTGLRLVLGYNLTQCFSLCISAHMFTWKLQRRKLLMI